MAWAVDAATAERWAREPAIQLWVELGDGATPFTVFCAMEEAGLDDVRRVGVTASTAAGILAGRKAGVGAVVAVSDDASLLRAEPDELVTLAGLGALIEARYGERRPIRPYVLLNPGPALTSERVKRAAVALDVCHREPEWLAVEERVRARLRAAAAVGDDHVVALVAASGTAADELALAAAVRPGKRILIVSNGVYGERLCAIADAHGLERVTLECAWTEPVDPTDVASALDADPTIDAVALVHHETTTGLLNPLRDVALAALDRDRRVVVDAVSSFGVEELDVAGWGIDFLACSSNKLLRGLPGAAFVLTSPEGVLRAGESRPRSVYLDLRGYLKAAATGSVPYTPSVPALLALDSALAELEAEGGIAARRAHYRERVAVLDAAFERLGLEQLIPAAARSHSIRTLRLPDGVVYDELHDRLKADGYVIYAGQGPLADYTFRVSCMGTLEPAALEAFAGRLAVALEREPARA